VFFRPAAELGRTQPPSFVAATAELASIADASKASRGPRRSASPSEQPVGHTQTPAFAGRGLYFKVTLMRHEVSPSAAPVPGHNPP
jgi:hypothetical protein